MTFTDQRAREDAIREMHGRELDGRVISVNKAQPKIGGNDDPGYDGYGGRGYSSGGRGSYGSGGDGGDRFSGGRSDCFKCGRPGHWARECPSADGGGGSGYVFLLALSSVVVVVEETGLTEIDLVTDILMTGMMAGAVEAATMTEIVWTAGMVGMVLVAMIDMLATGTCPVMTAFQMIVMGDLIDTL